jgi:apolipoprotein N-acyltransferase
MRAARLLVAAAAGALLSAALPPAGFWPLLLALVPLFALVAESRRPRDAFWLGFTFGLAFFTIYVLWLPASFASPEFFGSFFWLLYPPLLLILSSFWGLVTLAARLLGGGGLFTLALLPPLWIAMEWARTQGYFAFPWGTLGYAWLDTPVAQVADTVGVWGLGLISTSAAALLAAPFVAPRRVAFDRRSTVPARRALPAIGAVALVGAAWIAGSARLAQPPVEADHTALLVQGNIDPFSRLAGIAGEVRVQAGLTQEGASELAEPPDLVIWSEGAVLGGLAGARGADALARVQESSPDSAFLVGAHATDESASFNSAYTIAEGRLVDRYDKNYLVPFGERFPLADAATPLYRAVFGLFGLDPLTSLSAGSELGPLDSPLGRIAAYICYESVFPQVQRAMVLGGAELLVNITNDAWFSRGDGAAQHYAMGRMRAIETRRYLLRAGNDGITGVVDPQGRTLAQLPRGISAVMAAPFAMTTEVTPWVRYGNLLLPLLALWIAATMVWRLSAR